MGIWLEGWRRGGEGKGECYMFQDDGGDRKKGEVLEDEGRMVIDTAQ